MVIKKSHHAAKKRLHTQHRSSRLLQSKRLRVPALAFILVVAVIGARLVLLSLAAPGGGGGSVDQSQLPAATHNPAINKTTCNGGLNIAIVADVSGSIKPDAFTQMQTAIQDFVSSLLPST